MVSDLRLGVNCSSCTEIDSRLTRYRIEEPEFSHMFTPNRKGYLKGVFTAMNKDNDLECKFYDRDRINVALYAGNMMENKRDFEVSKMILTYIRLTNTRPLTIHIFNDSSITGLGNTYLNIIGILRGAFGKNDTDVLVHPDVDELTAFGALMHADHAILGRGSLCFISALLSKGVIYYLPLWFPPLESWWDAPTVIKKSKLNLLMMWDGRSEFLLGRAYSIYREQVVSLPDGLLLSPKPSESNEKCSNHIHVTENGMIRRFTSFAAFSKYGYGEADFSKVVHVGCDDFLNIISGAEKS